MRNINNDLTLKRNYLNKYRFLIGEYEQVKRKEHPVYRFAKDFYLAHDTDARAFLKYYNLFKQSGNELDLLPVNAALSMAPVDHLRKMNKKYWNYVTVGAINLR